MARLVPFDYLPHEEHPNEAHGFRNSGYGELRLTAIHGAGRFDTEWLAGRDETWTSKPKANR